MSDIAVSALIMPVIRKAYSHLHMSQVCAPCLQSAVTAPPLLGHHSYRLLEKDERAQYKRRRYYRRRKKAIKLPCGANCVPLQCVVATSHIHRMSTHTQSDTVMVGPGTTEAVISTHFYHPLRRNQ